MLTRFNKPLPKISFLCQPSDVGVIVEPRPAKSALPDWFRKIAPIDLEHVGAHDNGITIKRCMPFLDALSVGWALPLAAEVRPEISDGGDTVDYGWEFDRTMVSNHSQHQITGHPSTPRPPCKFHNYWAIRTAPGWSCLFVPPLNRPNGVFEAVAGIVDTDSYSAHIHFPFPRSAQTACTSSKRARRWCRSSRFTAPTPQSKARCAQKQWKRQTSGNASTATPSLAQVGIESSPERNAESNTREPDLISGLLLK